MKKSFESRSSTRVDGDDSSSARFGGDNRRRFRAGAMVMVETLSSHSWWLVGKVFIASALRGDLPEELPRPCGKIHPTFIFSVTNPNSF